MAKLIRSMTIPGTAAQFNAILERLAIRLGATWKTPTSEVLYFGKETRGKGTRDRAPTVPCRASWEIFPIVSQRPGPVAGIEAYEEPTGTRVDFLDGYHPGSEPWQEIPPIGPAFAAFAKMICEELSPLPARIARALELKERGLTTKQIAEELTGDRQETSERTVRRYLQKARG